MIIEFNILLTAPGHRVERIQLLKQTLREMGLSGRVLAADIDPLGTAYQAADGAAIVPPCSDASYVPAILDVCRKNRIQLVIPGIDAELAPLAAQHEEFAAAGVTLLASSPETIALCQDRRMTHAWFGEQSFPAVQQGTVAEALADPERWPLPVVVKPALPSHTASGRLVRQVEELQSLAGRVDHVVRPFGHGDEFMVDVLVNRQGKCVCAVPRRRIEVRRDEAFKAITVRDELLESLASAIAERLPGAYGPLAIGMLQDEQTGAVEATEITARLAGGYPLSWHAGANFPRWVIEEILDRPTTVHREWQDGLVMLRYYEALYLDSRYSLW